MLSQKSPVAVPISSPNNDQRRKVREALLHRLHTQDNQESSDTASRGWTRDDLYAVAF